MTRSDIREKYWFDFLQEVSENLVTNSNTQNQIWGLEPSEDNFWKWIVENKLSEITSEINNEPDVIELKES